MKESEGKSDQKYLKSLVRVMKHMEESGVESSLATISEVNYCQFQLFFTQKSCLICLQNAKWSMLIFVPKTDTFLADL